jgi:hypothetical protein
MKVSEVYPSNFITAGDLDGKELRLTIDRVADKNAVKREDGSPIDRIVIYFRGSPKGFVAGKTNARAIRLEHGNNIDEWVGKQITIFPTTTKIAKAWAEKSGVVVLEDHGKSVTVPCIRVKVPSVGGVK